MEIINKRKNYEYDTEYNYVETLKLIALISIFLEQKNNITSKDLYNLIKYFYDIKIDINDYLDYLNQEEGYDFDKIVDIPTNIVIMNTESEGHGKDFSWWTQNYQIIIKAATNQFIPSKEEYTKEKLEKLIKEKNIYPIYSFGKKTKNEVSKEKNNIKYLIPYQSKKLESKDIYFDFMVNRICSRISNDNLLKEIRRFIINLKLNSIEDEDRYYSENEYKILRIYDDLSNKLIVLYNSIDNKNTIDKEPINIIISY